MTTGEVADVTGLSRSTVRRAVWTGDLRARQTPGGHLRFTPEMVAEWIKSLEVTPRDKQV